MTFAEALDVLKQGGRVSREAWAGAMFLCVQPQVKVDLPEDHPAHPLVPTLLFYPQLLRVDLMGVAKLYDLPWSDVMSDDWTAVTN
jgi:hypothetical protein